MAITDTLTSKLEINLNAKLSRIGGGGHRGEDTLTRSILQAFSEGSGNNEASCWLSTTFTATTSGVTISLADSVNPLGAASDDVPTADPEGLDLRLLIIENKDDTNFITVGLGSNGVTQWLGGTDPTIKIPAGGVLVQTFPQDIGALNDGVDDEIVIKGVTADCVVELSVLYG